VRFGGVAPEIAATFSRRMGAAGIASQLHEGQRAKR
jgi:hypothetical protein